MNISYTRIGDYELPNFKLKDKKQYSIGKYGLLRLNFLKNNKKGLYTNLLMNDELNEYLHNIDVLTNACLTKLITELVEKENINEELKNNNQLLWVGKMNNIKNIAEEIILKEIIYGDSL